jgi:23S rRNA pseudouridine2457 synthase
MLSKTILFNKPYGVLCQFTSQMGEKCLADYISIKDIYAAGRLDKDSEGLLILTDDGQLQHQITSSKAQFAKTYWVQVEGVPSEQSIKQLSRGVVLNDGPTKPAIVRRIAPPEVWDREPPIRFRKLIPTSWLEITLREGRNRQVRRMTAAIGYPTLRLIRYSIGEWTLKDLKPGEWRSLKGN